MTGTATPAPPRRDSQQIRRSLAKFIGWGYLAYFAIVVPDIYFHSPTVASWWTPLAVTIVFVPGWAMLVSSYVARTARLTTVVAPICCGLGYLLAIGSWFLAWTGQHTTGSTGTWLVTFPGLAALTLVVTPRPWVALLHLAVALPAVQIANSFARSDRYGQLVITDVAWGLAFSALFVLAGVMAVRTGDQLDATYARTVRLAEKSSGAREREKQRKLYDRLVHDGVLAVMREAGRANDDPIVGKDARETLHDWAGHVDERSSKEPIAPEDVLHRLRAAVAKAHPGADITLDGDPRPECPPVVPMRVGLAVADAAAEAVRNARRHAGSAADVTVRARLDSLPVMVTITDDGAGFDPAAMGATKLGVTRSISERMSDVGGHAHIESSVGAGTTIELRWPR